MASHPVVRTVAITLVALWLGATFAQLGLTLGPTGSLDALVADAPDDPALRVAALRTSAAETVTPLALEREAAGLRLSGRLPDLSDSPLLFSITSEEAWPCRPSVSDPSARFAPTEVFVEGLGVLRPGLQPPLAGESPPGHVMLVLVYADRSVRVAAECVPGEDEPGYVLRAAFTLDEGWNVLAGSAVLDDDGSEVVTLREATAEEREAGRWYAPPPALVTPAQPPPRVDQAPQDRPGDGPPDVPAPPARQD